MKPIYLDYNASTPVDPAVARTMVPFIEDYFGNPSSAHLYGTRAREAVEKARGQVAGLLGCLPEEVIFTSGGTESDNMAIKGAAYARRGSGRHIITTAIEHPAVLEPCRYLEEEGFSVTYLPVGRDGILDPEDLRQAITSETILVTVMLANNETGTIQPLGEIAAITAERGIYLHTDAAQAVGKIPVDVGELGVDMLTVAGHKLYAPKGIGALYLRRGIRLEKLMHGAGHEQGMRAGTENVLEIVGLGSACELAGTNLESEGARMRELRDRLHERLRKDNPGIRLNGDPEKRLPNTLSIGFPGIEGAALLAELSGVAASAGAACHEDSVDISYTLAAMEVPREYAIGTVRFSVGRFTTEEEIDRAAKMISEAAGRMSPSADNGTQPESERGEVKLTHYTRGLGCACKLSPGRLAEVLGRLPAPDDPNILVGTETFDDATVYRIDDETAIVQTLDFFTPVVDDPYSFGAIAAANGLSDIYAMGAVPVFALNIVAFPAGRLPMEVLRQILKGAGDKVEEAGISILGGHTVDDTEPKFGLAVSGLVHPDRILRNSGASEGDLLILTKPLGTGVLSTALKRGMLGEAEEKKLVSVMSRLNRTAAEVVSHYEVAACTDVTGFGLLGHLSEMVGRTGIGIDIEMGSVPVISGVRELVAAGAVPGGTLSNLDYFSADVEWGDGLSRVDRIILADAQTSGGLLLSLPSEYGNDLENALRDAGIAEAAIIGSVRSGESPRIRING